MSDRRTPSSLPSDLSSTLVAMAQEIQQLKARVAQLEANQNRILPGDYRFEVSSFGRLRVKRVSTGNAELVTGPL